MLEKKISIVMPVLNGMPYFEKALDSVRKQTFTDIEILVVDSGSTDGTVDYIKKCSLIDDRIRLICATQKSMGHQYNLGISNARGEYIGFCESDDFLDEGAMQYLYEIAEKNCKPDCVKSIYTFFVEKESKVEIENTILPSNSLHMYNKVLTIDDLPILFFRDIFMWNGIYKRTFLVENNILLNETRGAAFQDTGFVLQVHMLSKSTVYGNSIVYHYRKDNEGASVYKATGEFAVNEMLYILGFFEQHSECKKKYLFDVLTRIFGLFSAAYGRDLFLGNTDLYEEKVNFAQGGLANFINCLPYSQKSKIERINLLFEFCNYLEDFRRCVLSNYRRRVAVLSEFWKHIQTKSQIVIFGVGEMGGSLAAALMRSMYEGEIIFCDNKLKKREIVMGCEAFPVGLAVQMYKDAVFLIPNMVYYKAMQRQLILLGVDTDNIVCAPSFGETARLEEDLRKITKMK